VIDARSRLAYGLRKGEVEIGNSERSLEICDFDKRAARST
jgi:hypothetical protein